MLLHSSVTCAGEKSTHFNQEASPCDIRSQHFCLTVYGECFFSDGCAHIGRDRRHKFFEFLNIAFQLCGLYLVDSLLVLDLFEREVF